MDFRLRMILWIPTLAYAAFLLLGGKNLASLGQVVFAVFQGADFHIGFTLAAYNPVNIGVRDATPHMNIVCQNCGHPTHVPSAMRQKVPRLLLACPSCEHVVRIRTSTLLLLCDLSR